MGLKKLLPGFAQKTTKMKLKLSKKTRFWNIIFKLPGITSQRKKNHEYFFPKKNHVFHQKIFFST